MRYLLIALALLLPRLAWAQCASIPNNFVCNGAALPGTKVDLNPIPPGQAQNYFQASDFNQDTQAIYDIRSYLEAQPSFTPGTSTPTYLYVSTTGSDNNTCTGPGTAACLTIQGAVNKVPPQIQHPYIISVGAGTFSAGAYISGFDFAMGQYGIGDAGVGGPYLKVVGTLAAVAPTTGTATGTFTSTTQGGDGILNALGGNPSLANWATATVSGATWTAHNFKGDLLTITGGTAVGTVVEIADNTSTVLTVVGTWPQATPDSTSTFAIQTATGGSVINGVLARPPGTTGYNAGRGLGNGGASFFVSNNTGTGWFSGNGVGASTHGGSTVDPPISIEGLDFEIPATATAVSIQGAGEYVAVRHTSINATNVGRGVDGVQAVGGASVWYEGNYCFDAYCVNNDSFNLVLVGPLSGYTFAFDNYAAGDGGSSAFLYQTGGSAEVFQNHVDNFSHGITHRGDVSFSVGNDFESLVDGIDDQAGLDTGLGGVQSNILVDGDTFNNTQAPFAADGITSVLEIVQDPVVGSGNSITLQAYNGGKLILNRLADGGSPLAAISGSTDFEVDYQYFTKAQIQANQNTGYAGTETRVEYANAGGSAYNSYKAAPTFLFDLEAGNLTGLGLWPDGGSFSIANGPFGLPTIGVGQLGLPCGPGWQYDVVDAGTNGAVATCSQTGNAWVYGSGGATSANPSAQVGLSAVNGTASTFMTSDSAPALSPGVFWDAGPINCANFLDSGICRNGDANDGGLTLFTPGYGGLTATQYPQGAATSECLGTPFGGVPGLYQAPCGTAHLQDAVILFGGEPGSNRSTVIENQGYGPVVLQVDGGTSTTAGPSVSLDPLYKTFQWSPQVSGALNSMAYLAVASPNGEAQQYGHIEEFANGVSDGGAMTITFPQAFDEAGQDGYVLCLCGWATGTQVTVSIDCRATTAVLTVTPGGASTHGDTFNWDCKGGL